MKVVKSSSPLPMSSRNQVTWCGSTSQGTHPSALPPVEWSASGMQCEAASSRHLVVLVDKAAPWSKQRPFKAPSDLEGFTFLVGLMEALLTPPVRVMALHACSARSHWVF